MSIRRSTGAPLLAFVVLSAGLAGALPAAAQTYTVLYPFRASVRITSSLVEVAPGEFYGTTDRGGAWSQGSVVKVTTAGVVTTLHSFSSNLDGERPLAGLVYDGAGFLYGTTSNGGLNGRGTVFRIKPDGTSFETVYDFLAGTDPFSPEAALIKGSDGKLYGTSRLGGTNDLGTVFSLDVSAAPATLTTLYSFSGGAMDGASPVASLFESGGFLYGTTVEGGTAGFGTVFRISLSGSMQWVTSFAPGGLGGANPKGGVVEKGGVFYGTTEAGGSMGAGTVFTITDAGLLTKAYEFGSKGSVPLAGLTLGADGLLYGTTNNGGANFRGTVFRIDPSATPLVEQTLHSFSDSSTNGRYPTTGVVMGSDLKLYGTTPEGGPGNYGVAYWVNPTLPAFGVFYADPGAEGAGPFSPLYRDGGGVLYGTASVGGNGVGGAIYKLDCLTPPCVLTTLRATQDLGMGQDFSGVVPGPGGFLYGTAKDSNSIYKIDTLNGSGFQKLYTFTGSPGNFPNGSFPIGVMERGGVLYGATASGGASDKGTLFKLDPASPSSLVWSTPFSGTDGRYPSSQLVAGSDGKLYGVTAAGGASDKGTLFRVTTGGTHELLHTFSGPDGSGPWAALTAAGPGIFYGTTGFGGANGKGTFFRLDATTTPATIQTLRSFAAGEVEGVSVLTLGSDGNFYGTSYGWGANRLGAVIQLAPSGALRILHSFSGTDGAFPRGGVLRLSDGTLLGTAEMAGPNDGGVVFQLNPATSSATALVSGGATTCAGGSVTLTAALTGAPPWSLTWSDGFWQSVSVSPATRVVAPSVSTIYTLTTFSDAFGEGTVSGSAPVTVSGVAPSGTITAPASAAPNATGLTASVPAAGGGATYAWTVTNGSLTSGQGTNGIVYSVGTGGFTGISVTITAGPSCAVTGYAGTAVGVAPAASLTFTHFAGTIGGPGAVDGPAAAARIASNTNGIVSDASGTLYIADGNNLTVRRISTSGDVTTLAGLARTPGSADGSGSVARFGRLWGIARSASGNLYVADLANYTLRKVTPAGVVTTVAGVAGSPGSENGPPGVARFTLPTAVAVDGSENVYVADGRTVRRVTPAGDVSTLAGDAAVYGDENGIGMAAHFGTANGLALDGAGFLYVSDLAFHTIRRIDVTTKEVTTFAGVSGGPGSNNGIGTAARFANPRSLVFDGSGHLFLADQANSTIRRIDLSTKEVTTFVGVPGAYGSADGNAATARFSSPSGLTIDGSGNLYVTEPLTAFNPAALGSTRVRKVTPAGFVSTVASVANERGGLDGAGPAARFFWPRGLATDPAGNVYVTELENHTLRKVTPGGDVTTLAGLAGVAGSDNGPLGTSRFAHPDGVAVDAAGYAYVADSGNHTIRRIDLVTKEVTTFAGAAGMPGSNDGIGGAARFDGPRGVAVDAAGFVYVADTGNHTIRKITPGGSVSTLAGAAGVPGADDGVGGDARFLSPLSLAVDASGALFVATSGKVRKVTAGGAVTTLTEFGSLGINAVALDVSGILYGAATNSNTIVKRTPGGVVTTLVQGQSQMEGTEDGTGSVARFFNPSGLAADPSGNLFVADTLNHSIRAGRTALAVSATIDSATGAVGVARQLGTSAAATTYAWDVLRRPSGSTASLSSTSGRTPTFTPDVADLYVFRLTASNGPANTSITLVSLAASPSGCTPPSAAITTPAAVEARTTSHTASVPDVGAGATYAWTIANGTFTSPDNAATVTWTAGNAGITTLTVTVTSATPCVASSNKQVRVRTRADATGDGKADPMLFRPSTGQWRVRQPGGSETLRNWGQAGDVPVPGDYDGDGRTDLAVYRPSDNTWWIIWSSDGSFHGGTWGFTGDVPVPGDYDGDGKTDLAVFRPSTGQWWVIPSGGGAAGVLGAWGTTGDVAVPADYDGDGRTDLAVYRPAGSALNPGLDAQWWVIPSGGGAAGILGLWGAAGDIPVPADYDGDGKADFATFRPPDGDWWVRQSSDGLTQARLYGRHWGQSGDVPVPADYDGDGKADWVVYRPSETRWYLLLSGTVPPGDSFLQGAAGDAPAVTAP